MNHYFIFDIESIGLHGNAFAVAAGVFIRGGVNGVIMTEHILLSCDRDKLSKTASKDDAVWVKMNIPYFPVNCKSQHQLRSRFFDYYLSAKLRYPKIKFFAECQWPVEARFLIDCIEDDTKSRNWDGPYPLHDIATVMACAGIDPMETKERLDDEKPIHHPLADIKQSARLLFLALDKIEKNGLLPCF